MKYHKLFNLIIIVTLILVGLWLSLAGLTQPVQAASAPLRLELALPPQRPQLQIDLEADLSITKANGVTTLTPGQTTLYTITVTNNDGDDTANATVTDNFSAKLTDVEWTCSADVGASCGTNGTNDINDPVFLLPGSSATYLITATVSPDATDSLTNTASVSPLDVTDLTPSNNTITDTDTLIPEADLTIVKSSNAVEVVPGTSVTYTIVASNNGGPSDITGATVTDDFSAVFSDVDWACTGSGGGVCQAPPTGTGDLAGKLVNLPVDSSVTFIVTGTVPSSTAAGPLVNTASITVPVGSSDSNPNNNSDSETDTLTPEANLSITKDNGVASLIPGNVTTYTIVVSNSGPSNANGITVTDTFPANLTGVNWSRTGTTGAGQSCATGTTSGNINCTINLAAGSSVTFTAAGTVNPSATGSLANTATLTPPANVEDTGGSNSDTDTDTLTPQANLSVTKTNGVTSLIPGNSTTYTIVVANSGPSNVNGITVTDTFPANLTGVNWHRTGTTDSGQTCPTGPTAGNINCTINLPPSGFVTFTVDGTVNPSATGSLTNTATISSTSDSTPGNNSATDTDTLTPQADLSIGKTSNAVNVVPGTSVTYTIVASNNGGPSNITGATVTDDFSAVFSDVDWTCTGSGGGVCQAPPSGSGDIVGKGVNLPVNSSVTFIVTGTVLPSAAAGPLVNTASITVPVGASDSNPNNNSDTETDTLTPEVNLSISKTNGVTSLIPGNVTTYTIVVNNAGPSAADGTGVTDLFPASLTGVTWSRTGTGGTCPTTPTAGNINCTINLAPGGSVTFTAAGTVSPGARGTLTNTVTLTPPADATDTTPGNNSATDVDTLTPQANLRVTKTDSPDPVIAGNVLTYTVTVFNDGPSSATGVTLSDNLDNSSVVFLSSTPSSPTCTLVGGDVGCNLGTIPSGGNTVVTIRTRVNSSTPAGFVTNSVLVEGVEDDPNTGNNGTTASTQVQVVSDLTITKLESKDPSAVGEPLTYTLRITNVGPSNAPQVNVSDNMPNGIPIGSISASQGSCSGTDPINCNLGSMAGGATALVTIVVNPTVTGTLVNTASVSVSGGSAVDPNPANNSSGNISTTINYVTDLAITNTSSPNPVIQGSNLTYNITVTNNGPSSATGVAVSNTLPGGVTLVSPPTASQGSCSGTTTIICSLGSMAKNTSETIAIIVKTNSTLSGNISSTAIVSGGGGLDAPANNSATATTTVNLIHKAFIPLTFMTYTELFIDNNTDGPITFTVVQANLTCNVPAGNHSFFCGSFRPGIYTIQVSAICGSTTVPAKPYDPGPQITKVSC